MESGRIIYYREIDMKNWQENVIRNRQDYLENIKKIDSSQYETAYGNAGVDIFESLSESDNEDVADFARGILEEM